MGHLKTAGGSITRLEFILSLNLFKITIISNRQIENIFLPKKRTFSFGCFSHEGYGKEMGSNNRSQLLLLNYLQPIWSLVPA